MPDIPVDASQPPIVYRVRDTTKVRLTVYDDFDLCFGMSQVLDNTTLDRLRGPGPEEDPFLAAFTGAELLGREILVESLIRRGGSPAHQYTVRYDVVGGHGPPTTSHSRAFPPGGQVLVHRVLRFEAGA